jgi:TonB-dependent receptor
MRAHRTSHVTVVAAVLALSTLPLNSAVAADSNTSLSLDLDSQPLEAALVELCKQGHLQLVIATDSLPAKISVPLHGSMPLGVALDDLLKGTGFTYKLVGDHTIAIVKSVGITRQLSDPPASPGATGATSTGTSKPGGNAEPAAPDKNASRGDQSVNHRSWIVRAAAFLGICISTSVTGPACAEDAASAEPGRIDEIVVTGFRKSIEDSIKIKRALDVVSDTVSASDVGQFPDGNLAESLQRITGVQITRQSPDGVTANEGQHVSVRGLPTEFNYVGLNGEGVASGSNNLIAYTSDRNFNFSVLAPDFISSLEVYKSPSADLTEGGVAATINVKTVLPFDIEQRVLKASIEGQSTSRATRAQPKLSAIYSDIFAEGRLGLTVGYALNKRKYVSTSATDFQFNPQTIAGQDYLVLDSNFILNTLDDFDTKTAYAALQYRPMSELTLSLIGLHTTTDDHAQFSSFGVRPSFSPTYSDLIADANAVVTTQVGDNSYFQAATFNHLDATKLDNFTLKADWSAGSLSIDGSLNYSNSLSTNRYLIISAQEWGAMGLGPVYSGGYQINPGDPIASFVFDPALDTSDLSNFFVGLVGGELLHRENTIRSARMDATYELPGGVIESIKVGARYAEERSTNVDEFNYDPAQANTSVAPYVTDSPMPAPTLSGYNGSANAPLQYSYFNTQSYLDALYDGSYDTWLSAGTTQQILNPSNQYTVKEKNTGLYAMARYKFEWSFPVHGNFGVRFVHTQQAVTNTAVDLNAITVIIPTPPPPAPSVIIPPGSIYTLERSYSDVLPSFNLAMDLKSDLVLRLAAAKVMSRPTLDSLVPRYSVSAGLTNTVAGGNPDLNPFRAWQGDLSLEYYFQPGSIASVALFYKDIESFIQTDHRPLVLQGVTFDQTLPVNSSGGYVEGVEVGYTQQFSSLPTFWSGFGVQANATWAQGMTDADAAAGLEAHAFQNLSKWTANASVFYSAYGVNARLAYNYRSDYLFDPNVRGIGTTSAFGDSFSTLDFQASYAISSHLTVFAEANNLARKPQVFEMRVANGGESVSYPQTWIEGERRLAAGFRLGF